MKLYEINLEMQSLLDQVDPETGELTCDMGQLEALQMERDEKLENLACAVKNYVAEASMIREEEKRLAERRKTLENKAARAKEFLESQLNGEKLSSSRVSVSYRKTEAVEIAPEFMEWAKKNDAYLRYKEPEADKVALKAALKAGQDVPGAELVERQSLVIK